MHKEEPKAEKLARLYRKLLSIVVLGIGLVLITGYFLQPIQKTRPVETFGCFMIPCACTIAAVLWHRRMQTKSGITHKEMLDYIRRQPLSKAAAFGMLVLVISRLLDLFK
jgi:hypothetical protein